MANDGGWYKTENGLSDKPSDVDTTSSNVYVYVRRNFELVPERIIDPELGEIWPEHWRWEEMKIPKEIWGIYKQAMGNAEALGDVYSALVEVVDLIMGGE